MLTLLFSHALIQERVRGRRLCKKGSRRASLELWTASERKEMNQEYVNGERDGKRGRGAAKVTSHVLLMKRLSQTGGINLNN